MRVLVTGMAGFAGRYLARELLQSTTWTLTGIARNPPAAEPNPRVSWRALNLLDAARLTDVIREVQPQIVIHLAAQSHVPTAWERPWETYEHNIHSLLNLFLGVIASKLTPRMLVVSSNEVYGAPQPGDLPLRETQVMRPNNPYAVSKAAQDLMAMQFYYSHQLPVTVARPFNHVGPGQDEKFVVPRFARMVAEIEARRSPPVMQLGNMTAQRDFTDVRDVARAYLALLQHPTTGGVYNVCSGAPHSIQNVLDTLLAHAGLKVEQQSDPAKFRQVDTPVSYGDASLLRGMTGWQPAISFEDTLKDMLTDARTSIKHSLQS